MFTKYNRCKVKPIARHSCNIKRGYHNVKKFLTSIYLFTFSSCYFASVKIYRFLGLFWKVQLQKRNKKTNLKQNGGNALTSSMSCIRFHFATTISNINAGNKIINLYCRVVSHSFWIILLLILTPNLILLFFSFITNFFLIFCWWFFHLFLFIICFFLSLSFCLTFFSLVFFLIYLFSLFFSSFFYIFFFF